MFKLIYKGPQVSAFQFDQCIPDVKGKGIEGFLN